MFNQCTTVEQKWRGGQGEFISGGGGGGGGGGQSILSSGSNSYGANGGSGIVVIRVPSFV